MVNLEYVIKSDCKPTAISLFFRGQHGSIIPDPCPWAFSYNWHQILFWRRYLFSLAFSQQLASVWDQANEAHRSSSPNVSHGRSPGPFPSQPPPWEFGPGSAGLSSFGRLQVAGHEPAWIWGAEQYFPGRSAQLSDMLSVLPQHAVRHMLEWLRVSLPALCPQGATWVEILRPRWEQYVESNSTNPLPISQFLPSPFIFTFFSLPDVPLNKKNVGLPRSWNSWERAIILFASLAFRAGSQQWCLGRWCTMVSPMLFQLSSTGAFQTALSFFHPFYTKASPFWPSCWGVGTRYVL